MKPNQSLLIDNYARIDYLSDCKNSFTLYLSNNIKVKRINLNTNNDLRNLNKTSFKLDEKKDIVIPGLCFCKIVAKAEVNVYVKNNVKVYVNLIISSDAVIKDLSANLQTKIKEKVKTATDLDVKEVNITVKKVAPKKEEQA